MVNFSVTHKHLHNHEVLGGDVQAFGDAALLRMVADAPGPSKGHPLNAHYAWFGPARPASEAMLLFLKITSCKAGQNINKVPAVTTLTRTRPA